MKKVMTTATTVTTAATATAATKRKAAAETRLGRTSLVEAARGDIKGGIRASGPEKKAAAMPEGSEKGRRR